MDSALLPAVSRPQVSAQRTGANLGRRPPRKLPLKEVTSSQDDRVRRLASGGEGDKRLQFCERCAVVDRLRRQRHRIAQMIGASGGDQGGGGV